MPAHDFVKLLKNEPTALCISLTAGDLSHPRSRSDTTRGVSLGRSFDGFLTLDRKRQACVHRK